MKMKSFILVLLLTFFFSCEEKEEVAVPSQLATDYLEELMETLQRYSINKNTIDWQIYRNKIFSEAEAAQSIEDTYPAIRLALSLLRDQHSIYITAEGRPISDTKSCPHPLLLPFLKMRR